jgi:tetratricopeptide (TPR) repeat protein
MRKSNGVLAFLTLILAAVHSSSAVSQSALNTEGRATAITLGAKESRLLEIPAAPGSLQVVEIQLQGGLVWIRSEEAPARMLDLGNGGHLFYALRTSADGKATLELRSGEVLRDAHLSLRTVTADYPEEQREHLHTAGVEFAIAETARRRQPGVAPVSDAKLHYDRAAGEAKAAGDGALLHWILNQKARFLMYQQSSFDAPREILLEAAALHSTDDAAMEAMTYKTLSSCEYFMGHLDAAVTDAEHALALYRETGDLYWQDVVLGNLIADYSEQGRTTEAAASAREALTDAEQVEDTAGVVFCLSELANLYRLQGDPQQAFQTFREAEAWSKDIRYAPLVLAEIEQDLGQFYMDMGLWTEAQMQLERCLREASAGSPGALEARALLAEVWRREHRGQRALSEYATAITTAKRLNLQPEEAALRIERSQTLLQLHQMGPARRDADEALRLADVQKNPTLRIGATLAVAAVDAANCSTASECSEPERMYGQAIALMQQTSEHEEEAIAYAGLARMDARLGRDEEALQSMEQALTLVERSRASLSSNVVAASYFEEWGEWYGLAERIALRLDRVHPGEGYREIAFRYTERARARAMLDAIGTPNSRPVEALPAEERRQIAANEEAIERDRTKLLTTGSAQVAAVLQHLYREQDELAAAKRSAGAALASTGGEHIASLEDVQRMLLDGNSAMVAFVPGTEGSERWLITQSSVQVLPLPAAEELRGRLAPLDRMLGERRPTPATGENATHYARRIAEFTAERDRDLERAGTLLLAGIPRTLKQLYVVADGDVLPLPWSALRLPCGARLCYAVELFAVSIEPSASIAVELRRRAPEPRKDTMLVVSGASPLPVEPTPRWTALGALPGSEREAEAIVRLAPGEAVLMLSGRSATPENVTADLSDRVAILHLATHTFLVPDHPELSGIALSPDTGADRNSVLWLHDIPSLHAPPLVTLSGCATQGGELNGEGLRTLTQAFFYAGAQQVVASLWSVDDDATVGLMTEFYRNLLIRRKDAAESLREAQRRMLARGADLSDWAAFAVDGVPAANNRLSETARN